MARSHEKYAPTIPNLNIVHVATVNVDPNSFIDVWDNSVTSTFNGTASFRSGSFFRFYGDEQANVYVTVIHDRQCISEPHTWGSKWPLHNKNVSYMKYKTFIKSSTLSVNALELHSVRGQTI